VKEVDGLEAPARSCRASEPKVSRRGGQYYPPRPSPGHR